VLIVAWATDVAGAPAAVTDWAVVVSVVVAALAAGFVSSKFGSPVEEQDTLMSETSTVSATPQRRSANRSRPDVKPDPLSCTAGQRLRLAIEIEHLRNHASAEEAALKLVAMIPQ
jgi:hypothetical protein